MLIGVLCADDRMSFVADELEQDYQVKRLKSEQDFITFESMDVLVLPIQGICQDLTVHCYQHKIQIPTSIFHSPKTIITGLHQDRIPTPVPIYSCFDDEEFLVENAKLTAEGLLCELIHHTECSIHTYTYDIVGYGHCGKEIASMFDQLNLSYRIIRRFCEDKQHFVSMKKWTYCSSIVINTAPEWFITYEKIKQWKQTPCVFDISSLPLTKNDVSYIPTFYKLNHLPNRFSSHSAASIYCAFIRRILYEK